MLEDLRILFWNINSIKKDKNHLIPYIVEMVRQHNINILLLAETNNINLDSLEVSLKAHTPNMERVVFKEERVSIFHNLGKVALLKVNDIHYNAIDFCINKIRYLVVGVHFIGQKYTDENSRKLSASYTNNDIRKYCDKHEIEHIIVVGDFNMNPYEIGMTYYDGMNAVISEDVAVNGYTSFQKRKYPIYVNPSWHIYGQLPNNEFQVPGSYFYRDSKCIFWHMFDQVIVSPNLFSKFKLKEYKILTKVERFGDKGNLISGKKKRPIGKYFSDHLPIKFSIELK